MALHRSLIAQARVAGLKFHEYAAVADELEEGQKLLLRRDKDNQYDANAVAVFYHSDKLGREVQIGFVERNAAPRVAGIMDAIPKGGYYATLLIYDTGPNTSEYNRMVTNVMAATEHEDPVAYVRALQESHDG